MCADSTFVSQESANNDLFPVEVELVTFEGVSGLGRIVIEVTEPNELNRIKLQRKDLSEHPDDYIDMEEIARVNDWTSFKSSSRDYSYLGN